MNKEEIKSRFQYLPEDEIQVASYDDLTCYKEIQKNGEEFCLFLSVICPESREQSLAITKVQEAVMWAKNAISKEKGDNSLERIKAKNEIH